MSGLLRSRTRDPADLASGDELRDRNAATPRALLAAIDGSPGSRLALLTAARMAKGTDASLVAIHVVRPQDPVAFDAPWVVLRAAEGARRAGEDLLAEAKAIAGDVLTSTELHIGKPADVICRRAAELGVDLIVVGARRRVGPVAAAKVSAMVAERAPCSVLVVRERPR